MGKQTPQAPAAPDPVALSNAQGAANKDTAIAQARLNAVNSNSPFGSISYTEGQNPNDPSVPTFTQNVTLSPQQQQLYDTQQGVMQGAYNTAGQAIGNVQNTLSTPFSLSGLPQMQTGVQGGSPQAGYGSVSPLFGIAPARGIQGGVTPTGQNTSVGYSNPIQSSFSQGGNLAGVVTPTGQHTGIAGAGDIQTGIDTSNIQQTPLSAADFSRQGQQVQDAVMQRFNEDIGRRQEDVESRLNAQGIQRGSQGFSNAQDDLSRARNDALGQAVLLGSQEQDRLFGQQLAANQNLFGQRQAQGNFTNSAQQQQFGQNLDRGNFINSALNNQMQQQLAAGQFQNQTAGQQYQQNLGAAQFGNQAQQQGYGQALSNAQFGNDALSNIFGQQVTAGQFGNAAQGQQFGQNVAQQQAYNQAAQQQTANNAGQSAFYNTAQQQAFEQAMRNATLQNQSRQQGIAEQQLVRSQPINEIATLLGLGGGIQVPNGAPNFGVNVGQTDVMGAYGMQQQALQNQYNQQLAANNALWGGLGNLGGALGGAWIMSSDRRVKNVIRKVGETATGTPLYLYSYKHDPEREIVGVMAQDIQKVNPMAVHDVGGVLAVDYAMVA